MQYFPTQIALLSGLQEYNKRWRWACGRKEHVGREEEPRGGTICGQSGWMTRFKEKDIPALVQYSSTDARECR